MEETEKCWIEAKQTRDSGDGSDVACPRLLCGMVAKLGREATFPGCPRAMPGGNLGSLSHSGGLLCAASPGSAPSSADHGGF